MQFPKNSRKLVSLLTLAAMLSPALAMSQEGRPRRFLTPGQVANEANGISDQDPNFDRARDAEVQARNEQEERNRRNEEERSRRDEDERRHRDEDNRRFEQERSRAEFERARQAQIDAQNAAIFAAQERQRQADIDAQNAAVFAQQQAEAQRLADEAQRLAQQGSSSIGFVDVTRKAGGEWLRVTLSRPQQLSQVSLAVLSAGVKIHEVRVYTSNGQTFTLDQMATRGNVIGTDGVSIGDMQSIQGRVTAIDFRVESMGAKAAVSMTVNSLEGRPTLTKTRFVVK